jgi:hypothetical protein
MCDLRKSVCIKQVRNYRHIWTLLCLLEVRNFVILLDNRHVIKWLSNLTFGLSPNLFERIVLFE